MPETPRPSHWTEANEIAHWAWEAFGYWENHWLESLPEDHAAHFIDPMDQHEMFFAAHPDGWPPHPDAPTPGAP